MAKRNTTSQCSQLNLPFFPLKTANAKFCEKGTFLQSLEFQNVHSWKPCCSSTLLVLRTTSIFQRPLEKTNIIGRRPAKSNLNILWHPLRAISASRYGLKKRLTFFKWQVAFHFFGKTLVMFFFQTLKWKKFKTFLLVPKSYHKKTESL